MARNAAKKPAAKKSGGRPSIASPAAAPPAKAVQKLERELRAIALALPEASEDFPWGERAIKVKKKVFLFMHASAEGLSLGLKLSHSNGFALTLPFCEPTHYGLGKSGWVTAKFAPKEKPPVPLLQEWIRESYCAVAPKRLVGEVGTVKSKAAKKKKSAAKKKK